MKTRHRQGRWVREALAAGAAVVCAAGLMLGGCAGKGGEGGGATTRAHAAALQTSGKLHVKTAYNGQEFEYIINKPDAGDWEFSYPEAWQRGGFGDALWAPQGYLQLGEWRHKEGRVVIEVKDAPETLLEFNRQRLKLAKEAEHEDKALRPAPWAPGRSRRIAVTNDIADAKFEINILKADDNHADGELLEEITVIAGPCTVYDTHLLSNADTTDATKTKVEVRATNLHDINGRMIYEIKAVVPQVDP